MPGRRALITGRRSLETEQMLRMHRVNKRHGQMVDRLDSGCKN